MSFNPMMTLLVRAVVDWLEPKPSVVELGNQTFNADDDALRRVLDRSRGRAGLDCDGLATLLRLPREERRDKTAAYYRCLGFSEYQAIDVNETYDSLVMDLNRDLVAAYGFSRTFSLVTNNGTGEHVFDQGAVLRNVHALARRGGIMLHLVPCVDYVNHGFYCYQPNLFSALAAANGYELLALGLGDREGRGAAALAASGAESPSLFLREERPLDLASLLAKPKPPSRGALPRARYWARRLRGATRPGDRLGATLDWLQRRRRNLLVFAALRKREDRPFRAPVQGRYAEAVSDPGLRRDFGGSAAEPG